VQFSVQVRLLTDSPTLMSDGSLSLTQTRADKPQPKPKAKKVF